MLKIKAHNSRIQETMLIENNVFMFMPRPNQMNTILAWICWNYLSDTSSARAKEVPKRREKYQIAELFL